MVKNVRTWVLTIDMDELEIPVRKSNVHVISFGIARSETLYFLFKVRRARVIKIKTASAEGRGGGRIK